MKSSLDSKIRIIPRLKLKAQDNPNKNGCQLIMTSLATARMVHLDNETWCK